MFQIRQNKEIIWLEVQAIKQTEKVLHAFSTRLGGVSQFPYRSLNLGLYTNDDENDVIENRKRFLRPFSVDPNCVATVKQIHSDKIVRVDENFMANPFLQKIENCLEADALITNKKGIALFVNYADCVPLIFFDPKKDVISAVHAGWRGTLKGIGAKVVKEMISQFDSSPEDIIVAIGPSIGPLDFEIGLDVIEEIKQHYPTYTELLVPSRENHAYFDIWLANEWQLQSVGIKKENIHLARLSTMKRNDLFFSHRKSLLGETGRMGTFIMLT